MAYNKAVVVGGGLGVLEERPCWRGSKRNLITKSNCQKANKNVNAEENNISVERSKPKNNKNPSFEQEKKQIYKKN